LATTFCRHTHTQTHTCWQARDIEELHLHVPGARGMHDTDMLGAKCSVPQWRLQARSMAVIMCVASWSAPAQ